MTHFDAAAAAAVCTCILPTMAGGDRLPRHLVRPLQAYCPLLGQALRDAHRRSFCQGMSCSQPPTLSQAHRIDVILFQVVT